MICVNGKILIKTRNFFHQLQCALSAAVMLCASGQMTPAPRGDNGITPISIDMQPSMRVSKGAVLVPMQWLRFHRKFHKARRPPACETYNAVNSVLPSPALLTECKY